MTKKYVKIKYINITGFKCGQAGYELFSLEYISKINGKIITLLV